MTARDIFARCDGLYGKGGLKHLTYSTGWVNAEWVVEVKGEFTELTSGPLLDETCSTPVF